MATIKVKFRPSAVIGVEGTLYYSITHERRVRQQLSGCKLLSSEWDVRHADIVIPPCGTRREQLLEIRENIRRDLRRFAKIESRLQAALPHYSADDIVEEYRRFRREYSLFPFMEGIIRALKDNGRIRTAETYRSALNSFRKFRLGRDIMLDAITPATMEQYGVWLKRCGVVPNTVSFYARILRAVYNRAVESGAIDDLRPFRHIYTGIAKTVKRALPLNAIRRIKALDLAAMPAFDYARDIFMLSFYLRGMSFIDMAFLKKSDLRNGRVTYRRRKTGRRLAIAWEFAMQRILDKYPRNPTPYLLPVITKRAADERCAYRNAAYKINRHLKEVAALACLSVPLTLYAARHSWATAARAEGIPLGIISEGMGHDSETTTRIYMATLDTSAIDRANRRLLAALK